MRIGVDTSQKSYAVTYKSIESHRRSMQMAYDPKALRHFLTFMPTMTIRLFDLNLDQQITFFVTARTNFPLLSNS